MSTNGHMKTVELVQDDNPQAEVQVDRMHTKQIAEAWGITTRQLNKIIEKAESILGRELGEPGEKNRIYYSAREQMLIKMARFGSLQKPLQSEEAEPDLEDTPEENNRIQDEKAIVKQQSSLVKGRLTTAHQQGVDLAKAELKAKVQGYVETRAAGEEAFEQFVSELDQGTITIDVQPVRRTTRQKLIKELL